MKNEHTYKIVHKYLKRPQLLERFGFAPFADESGETVVAKPLKLPFDCGIVKNTKRLFETFYKDATDEEKAEDFKDFRFNEDGTAVVTPEMEKEWTECQLCFYPNGVGKNQLFINAPDHNQYFNKLVLDECAKADIEELLANKVIYKSLVR